MFRTISKIYIFSCLLVFISCDLQKAITVPYSNPQIAYSGRIDTTKIDGAEFYWSGTSIKINFKGESLQILIEDEKGDNYYNVLIDGNKPFLFKPDTIKQYYEIVSKLPKGKHTAELFRRTEWNRGKTIFYGFKILGKAKLLRKSKEKKRKIEFYGNSVTAGYAVEDISGDDSPDSTNTNNYLSYSAITARHFNAEYHCICRSGIGITVSWNDEIMPEIYDRINPTDLASKWNFDNFQSNIVVVNLLQNDTWLVDMPEYDQFLKRFGSTPPTDTFITESYQNFVSNIRLKYPKASIICMLGNVIDYSTNLSYWNEYITNAVSNLNDDKIYTLFVPSKGTPGHPSIEEQQDLANTLISFINNNIDW